MKKRKYSSISTSEKLIEMFQRLTAVEVKIEDINEKVDNIESDIKELKNIILNGTKNHPFGLVKLGTEFKLFKKIFWIVNISILLTLVGLIVKDIIN